MHWFSNPLNRIKFIRTGVSVIFWVITTALLWEYMLFVFDSFHGFKPPPKGSPKEALCMILFMVFAPAFMCSMFLIFFSIIGVYFRGLGYDYRSPKKKRVALVSYLRWPLSKFIRNELIIQTKLYTTDLISIILFVIYSVLVRPILWVVKIFVFSFSYLVWLAGWVLKIFPPTKKIWLIWETKSISGKKIRWKYYKLFFYCKKRAMRLERELYNFQEGQCRFTLGPMIVYRS